MYLAKMIYLLSTWLPSSLCITSLPNIMGFFPPSNNTLSWVSAPYVFMGVSSVAMSPVRNGSRPSAVIYYQWQLNMRWSLEIIHTIYSRVYLAWYHAGFVQQLWVHVCDTLPTRQRCTTLLSSLWLLHSFWPPTRPPMFSAWYCWLD